MATITLPYSELRIANAFKPGVELTLEDVIEMQRRVIAESKEWKRRKSREENAGGFDEDEIARQRNYSRRRAELRRAAKAVEMPPAWGAPIGDPAGIWD